MSPKTSFNTPKLRIKGVCIKWGWLYCKYSKQFLSRVGVTEEIHTTWLSGIAITSHAEGTGFACRPIQKWFRGSLCTIQEKVQVTCRQIFLESETECTSGPTKWTSVQQKLLFFFYKKERFVCEGKAVYYMHS